MKLAVIYARYSSDRQTEQSIEGQVHECQRFAQRNDIVIVHTYIDRAMSGTNDNREDFQRMLKDSDKKSFDYVLVYKLDRFSRNKYEMAIHRKRLKDNGIKILSAMENIPDSPEGTLLESLLEGMNQYYSEELSQKTKRGMNETRKKGNFIGGVVNYGYVVSGNKVLILEEEASVVRDIFTQYANGKRIADIIRDLHNRGITNRGAPFKFHMLYSMLRKEKYTGIYRVNGIVYDKIYPAIIPTDLFELVGKRIDANKHGKHVTDVSYLLRGLVYCGLCGTKMVSYTGTSKNKRIWRYYKCYRPKNICHSHPIRKEHLEKIILDTLYTLLSTEKNIETLVDKIYTHHKAQMESEVSLKYLEREYAKITKSLKNLITAIESGLFTDSTKQRLEELEGLKKDLEYKIALEKAQEQQTLPKETIRDYLLKALRQNEQNLITLLVKRVTLYDDKVVLTLKYGKDNPITTTLNNKKNSDGNEPCQGSFFIAMECYYEVVQGCGTLVHKTTPPKILRKKLVEVWI